MTTLRTSESKTATAGSGRHAPRVWGFGPADLNDRFWATRRVQVVRAGSGADRVDGAGPALYLLLDERQLVLFHLKPVLRRLNWLKPRVARVRLSQVDSTAYIERVETHGDGRLSAIRREYGSRTQSTAQVLLTADAKLARQWAQNEGGRSCRRAVYRTCGRESVAAISIAGHSFDQRKDEEVDSFLRLLMAQWRRPEAVLDGVYVFQPGVWLHESVEMAPEARLIGPLWVGGGVTLDSADPVIGPRIVGDHAVVSTPRAVDWGELSAAAWRLTARPMTAKRLFGKRAFDILFSMAVLGATAPMYPLIVLAIFLEDGWPPFFAHRRQTVRGRTFPCLKFRTMKKNAEEIKEQLATMNQADGPQFFIEDDPRIFRVGKILRKTQLDEIPQFINVLLGHMSVVGPRPSPDKENQYCPAWREARLSVRPGVTGLWQIRRTREPQTDFQEWIKYDLEYVQHRSWRLDFVIIAQTIKKTLGG